jgi:hypothetical protein
MVIDTGERKNAILRPRAPPPFRADSAHRSVAIKNRLRRLVVAARTGRNNRSRFLDPTARR